MIAMGEGALVLALLILFVFVRSTAATLSTLKLSPSDLIAFSLDSITTLHFGGSINPVGVASKSIVCKK